MKHPELRYKIFEWGCNKETLLYDQWASSLSTNAVLQSFEGKLNKWPSDKMFYCNVLITPFTEVPSHYSESLFPSTMPYLNASVFLQFFLPTRSAKINFHLTFPFCILNLPAFVLKLRFWPNNVIQKVKSVRLLHFLVKFVAINTNILVTLS